eukprot:TRINITY_DN7193_c0_g1_i2.p1 TRINITY_DN7193_c0_g1~~TRINITY_DN7193_c0_g1_i2.p1  ORF type:complete len:431 (-),score=143.93 TRINITY_DN7193_c0_g1_i2:52-1344(-)
MAEVVYDSSAVEDFLDKTKRGALAGILIGNVIADKIQVYSVLGYQGVETLVDDAFLINEALPGGLSIVGLAGPANDGRVLTWARELQAIISNKETFVLLETPRGTFQTFDLLKKKTSNILSKSSNLSSKLWEFEANVTLRVQVPVLSPGNSNQERIVSVIDRLTERLTGGPVKIGENFFYSGDEVFDLEKKGRQEVTSRNVQLTFFVDASTLVIGDEDNEKINEYFGLAPVKSMELSGSFAVRSFFLGKGKVKELLATLRDDLRKSLTLRYDLLAKDAKSNEAALENGYKLRSEVRLSLPSRVEFSIEGVRGLKWSEYVFGDQNVDEAVAQRADIISPGSRVSAKKPLEEIGGTNEALLTLKNDRIPQAEPELKQRRPEETKESTIKPDEKEKPKQEGPARSNEIYKFAAFIAVIIGLILLRYVFAALGV